METKIAATKLKGVDEPYRVYRVGRKHQLYGLHAPGAEAEAMKAARGVFSKGMIRALRDSKP